MHILFVCLGNICRSPTAEAVLRTIALREAPGRLARVDSAGTADYHIGEPPDRRSQQHAQRRGYDLSSLRARQVEPQDFERFDLLLAMDAQNLAELRRIAPATQRRRVHLFLEYAGHAPEIEVPDPYYGGPADFERVIDLAELASRRLLARLDEQAR
ncbi:MAG: low molecular weight protein-tyrosine-phosphatase [Steroidobacteraceae bacterium]